MKRYKLIKNIQLIISGRFKDDSEALKTADKVCIDCFNDDFVDSIRNMSSCSLSVKGDNWKMEAEDIITRNYVLSKLEELGFKEIIPNLYRGVIKRSTENDSRWISNTIYFVYLEGSKGYYWEELCGSSYKDYEWMDSMGVYPEKDKDIKTFKMES